MNLLGIVALLGVARAMSNIKQKVNLRTVAVGIGVKVLLGTTLLGWESGRNRCQYFSDGAASFLDVSVQGASFSLSIWQIQTTSLPMENSGLI